MFAFHVSIYIFPHFFCMDYSETGAAIITSCSTVGSDRFHTRMFSHFCTFDTKMIRLDLLRQEDKESDLRTVTVTRTHNCKMRPWISVIKLCISQQDRGWSTLIAYISHWHKSKYSLMVWENTWTWLAGGSSGTPQVVPVKLSVHCTLLMSNSLYIQWAALTSAGCRHVDVRIK